jgi:hypothetical protein
MAAVAHSTPRVSTILFLPRRVFWATLGLALIITLWEGFGWATAPTRISPELQAALDRHESALYDIAVTLPFAPRQFHIKLFQSYGTFAGSQDTTVLIRRVAPDRIHEIARKYWVQRITLTQLQ